MDNLAFDTLDAAEASSFRGNGGLRGGEMHESRQGTKS